MTQLGKDQTIELLHQLQKRIDGESPEMENRVLTSELEKAINELQVYQAELETQNEELRQVQYQLEKSRNRYLELFNYAPTGYLIVDEQYRIQEANIALLELLDVKRMDVEDKPLLYFVKSSDHRSLISLLDEIQSAHHNNRNVIVQLKHSKTRYKTVKIDGRLTSSTDFDGQNIMLTATDLTELKQTQSALRESENLYRSLVHSSQDHVFMLSTDGYYMASNEKFSHLLPLESGGVAGKNISQTLSPENTALYINKLREVALKRQPVEFDLSITRDEQVHYFHERLYPIMENDALTAIGGISQDITKLKEADFERTKLQNQLNQTQKLESLGNLAGGIAHDFNNILSAIIGFTELAMSQAKDNSLLAEDLGEIYRGGKRAKELVQQILQFAKQTEEEKQPVSIDTIAGEVTKFLRSSIPSNIEIRERLDSTCTIFGNGTQIYQILLNLCTNGYQAMDPDGGILSISAENVTESTGQDELKTEAVHMVKIVVSDSGCGIAPSIIDSIFDPYFTTKEQKDGSGMGLAVVHGIIKNHGGTITVESETGKGSTFTILLPAHTGEEENAATHQSITIGGTESILFVDDEEPIAKMTKKVLENLGYHVTTCCRSMEALALFKNDPLSFDLVITDMTMPLLTGDKLAREMMKVRPDLPVILCSGYNKNINSEIARELGIKSLVAKPLILSDFSREIRNALEGKSSD